MRNMQQSDYIDDFVLLQRKKPSGLLCYCAHY